MGLRHSAAILAVLTAFATSPSNAETVTRNTVVRGDRTVISTRDEDGRRRTKIIVNRRSFLDPGTQVFQGENRYNSGPALVWQPPGGGPDRNTAFDRRDPLPGPFDLPFKSNPVGRPD